MFFQNDEKGSNNKDENNRSSSKRSFINSQYLISADIGIVGIYGSPNSRTVYLESGIDNEGIIKLDCKSSDKAYTSDLPVQWNKSTLTGSASKQASEINLVKQNATTIKELQLTMEDFTRFKNAFPNDWGYIVNGEQDDMLEIALKSIGETIVFNKSDSGCTIV